MKTKKTSADKQYLRDVLEQVRSRLLDQTRRNRLLNYKESGRDIAVIDEMPDQVFEHLVLNGSAFFLDAYEPGDIDDQLGLGDSPEALEPDRTLPSSRHQEADTARRYTDDRLQTSFGEKDLERRLRKLYRDHRTIIEETGANNLYLAIGFLEWANELDPFPSRSPLILVPVRLEKDRGDGITKYRLLFDDTALDTNFSLAEKLKNAFNLGLPELEEEERPEGYWNRVESAIASKQKDGWSIVREMALGLFRFNKQVMWHDLDPSRWPNHTPLLDKGVLKRILLGTQPGQEPPGQLRDEYHQDEISKGGDVPQLRLIRDADSSQYAALVDALSRDDGLVVEGPPGTGKSQTIANLIAVALHEGLSVLFIAEKMAALDVVYRRLEDADVGDFCLELHGLKTRKVELLHSVLRRLERSGRSRPKLQQREAALEDARSELIEFSKALKNPVGPEGLPLHDLPWRVESLRQRLPDGTPSFELDPAEAGSEQAFRRARNLLSDLGREWASIPREARVAWAGYHPASYEESQEPSLRDALVAAGTAAERAENWLTEHGVHEDAPSMLETKRLLAFADLDPESTLPNLPPGSDRSRMHRVVHDGLRSNFAAFLTQIREYFETVRRVNDVFDYAHENAASYAERLAVHANRLTNVACEPEVTVVDLPRQHDVLLRVLEDLESLPDLAAPVLSLGQGFARTLEDFQALAERAAALSEGPPELSIHASEGHTRATVQNFLDGALSRKQQLESQADQLTEFHLGRTTNPGKIASDAARIESAQAKWFPFLSSQYRHAKRRIRTLLKEPRGFSRRPEFLSRLSGLVEFCKERDEFAADPNLHAALGSLFAGLDTDWNSLTKLIEASQRLRSLVGGETAAQILRDWNGHVDQMMGARDSLHTALERIHHYARTHPFPQALWQRPTIEIASTLAPWAEMLDEAANEVSPSWCRSTTTLQQASDTVETYREAKERESAIENRRDFGTLLGDSWKGAATNLALLEAEHEWVQARVNAGVGEDLLRWAFPAPDELQRREFANLVHESIALRDALSEQADILGALGSLDPIDWIGGERADLSSFRSKLNACIDSIASLPLMARWNQIRADVIDMGLEPIANAVANGSLHPERCSDAFEFAIYSRLLSDAISRNRQLERFGHERFENLRERFAELDKEMLKLNARVISTRLCGASIPEGVGHGPVRDYSERRLLLHEANKHKRHIPIRQLVRRAGNALQALKPCFLMSPLTVAQYLPPGEIEFDLVVMDEASQLRPEDALGAIARGRKVVVVGDPKQLPPTSFFDTAVAEDEEVEETIVDDTESILDVCLKQLPFRRLRWHYRSQHESLIQFSNDRFYDGDLIVFPSPRGESREFGVHYNYIEEPSYRNGRNRKEAKVVVENIVRHFQRHQNRSLGVAAFNKRQAEEIELLLDRFRAEDPATDELIASHDDEEPLFIKNLENVQGDERDVIFISTTYGPEQRGGPVFQRFGPINSELGWRRLNVIATRARQRVELFTSMRPSDIRAGEGARKGVVSLRDYLEYAATGRVRERGIPTGSEHESDFEAAVAKILGDLGYEYDPQVGVAGFFIDIGVRHPERPGEYLMGIECDGATYHSSRSVRDRDRLRQDILEGKGWRIHRIWSTSWFHVRGAEIERLQRALKAALVEDRRLWRDLGDYESAPEVVMQARAANEEELETLEEETRDSLEEALNRFWETNIKPRFPDRDRSILSNEMVGLLAQRRPKTDAQWFDVVPMSARQNMRPEERPFLEDILDVVAEYA